MKRISDEVIARALEKVKMFKGYDLTDAVCDNDRVVAQAQLEADQKEMKSEINTILTECKEYHKAKVKEIKEGLEKKYGLNHYDPDDNSYLHKVVSIPAQEWQLFWQEYGGD